MRFSSVSQELVFDFTSTLCYSSFNRLGCTSKCFTSKQCRLSYFFKVDKIFITLTLIDLRLFHYIVVTFVLFLFFSLQTSLSSVSFHVPHFSALDYRYHFILSLFPSCILLILNAYHEWLGKRVAFLFRNGLCSGTTVISFINTS